MKLVISKSKDGKGYYTKIQNDFNGKHIEKYLSLHIPKGTELEYGLYDVDGFLSVFEKRDGTAEFKLVVTNVMPIKKDNYNVKTESTIGEQIEIKDEDLPF